MTRKRKDLIPATLYCRISADRTGQRAGVERQERECRELAARLEFNVERVLIDNDLSATTGKLRPAFEELLKLSPGAVVVWHLDRLVRVTKDLERVLELGVDVHAVTSGHLDLSNPAGRAVARTVTAWATYEVEQKKLRHGAAFRQALAAGKRTGGRRPFGYSLPGMVVIEDEAEAIRDGVAMVLAGETLRAVAREWNSRGLLSPQPARGVRDTPDAPRLPWTAQGVSRCLRKPALAGLRAHRGAVVGAAAWDAVVDRAAWEAAQTILSAPGRRTGGGPRALLTGVAVCGECGEKVHAGGRRVELEPGGVYRCPSQRHISRDRSQVDRYVVAEVAEHLAMFEALESGRITFTDDAGDAALGGVDLRVPARIDPSLGRELEALEKRLDALASDLALSEWVLGQRAATIEARIAEIREQIAQQAETASQRSQLADWLDLGIHESYADAFRDAAVDTQRAIIARVAAVKLLPPGRGTRTFRPESVVIRWLQDPFSA